MDVLDVLSNAVLPEVSLEFAGADGQPWQVAFARIREALSEPYECSLILTLPTPGAEPDGLLGGAAVVEIRRGLRSRKVQGLVRRVEDLGTTAAAAVAGSATTAGGQGQRAGQEQGSRRQSAFTKTHEFPFDSPWGMR